MPFFLGSCTQNLFQSKKKGIDPVFYQSDSLTYTIKKDDKISISIWGHDDLGVGSIYGIYNSNEVYGKWLMVDKNGFIDVPKLGQFQIEGLSVREAEITLTKQFSTWIKEPIINVKVLNKEITVLGEFTSPGKLGLERDKNQLIDVLGFAGDFDFYADKSDIQVIREIDGETYVAHIDLTTIDGYHEKNIAILPGDVVYAPSRKGKTFDKKVTTLIPIGSAVSTLAIIASFIFEP
ncbi:polysaccharide biosynthesis/export family protein [Fulvivirga sediminis]|nr:polysaccharide biosynthesis/export family protein [Fulvivirga sediminis]